MEKEQVLMGAGHGEGGLPSALLAELDKAGESVTTQKVVTKGGNGSGNGGAPEEKRRETPEEFRARKHLEKKEKLEKKLERASKPETMLVSRNAWDTNDLVILINCFDFQFRAMRDRVGTKGSKVTLEVFQQQLEKTDALKQQIHQMNKELSLISGAWYKPPRGFK
jgi:hypothetical protein